MERISHKLNYIFICILSIINIILGFTTPQMIEERFGWLPNESTFSIYIWLISSILGIITGLTLSAFYRKFIWLICIACICAILYISVRFTVYFQCFNMSIVSIVCMFTSTMLWRLSIRH